MLRFLLLQNGDSIANLQALLSALRPDLASATLSINQMFLALPQKGSHGGICCAFAIPCLVSQTFLQLPSHPSAQHQMQKNNIQNALTYRGRTRYPVTPKEICGWVIGRAQASLAPAKTSLL